MMLTVYPQVEQRIATTNYLDLDYCYYFMSLTSVCVCVCARTRVKHIKAQKVSKFAPLHNARITRNLIMMKTIKYSSRRYTKLEIYLPNLHCVMPCDVEKMPERERLGSLKTKLVQSSISSCRLQIVYFVTLYLCAAMDERVMHR